MKILLLKSLVFIILAALPGMVKSQVKINSDSLINRVSGCYNSMKTTDGLLILSPDRTFQWTRNDTISGSWRLKNRFTILPFNSVTLILEYNGRKSRFEYYVDGQQISIGKPWLMKQTPCR